MTLKLSAAQKKLWHTVSGMLGAGVGYVLVTHLPIGPDLKVPLLALLVGVIIRGAGAVLAKVETNPPKGPA